jgi:hypothetical protein
MPGESSDYCTYISRPDESIQRDGESDSTEDNDSTLLQLDGNVTIPSGWDTSDSQHSGSVNLECRSNMNGRRAAICQLDGNQTMNSISNYDSEEELESEPF